MCDRARKFSNPESAGSDIVISNVKRIRGGDVQLSWAWRFTHLGKTVHCTEEYANHHLAASIALGEYERYVTSPKAQALKHEGL